MARLKKARSGSKRDIKKDKTTVHLNHKVWEGIKNVKFYPLSLYIYTRLLIDSYFFS